METTHEKQLLCEQVCMWLGQCRDKLPPVAVTQLQDIIDVGAIAARLKG